jgi:hypothetical protein
MDELIAWWRRHLDEFERVAREDSEFRGDREPDDPWTTPPGITAERAILDAYEAQDLTRPPAYYEGLEFAIRHLAAASATASRRRGYREEWRP